MTAQRQYATATAFRPALEARVTDRARRDGVDLHRLRRQVAFDRLLARRFDQSQPVRDGWVLKGGYALEMRFHLARWTKDLDLTVRRARFVPRSLRLASLRLRSRMRSQLDCVNRAMAADHEDEAGQGAEDGWRDDSLEFVMNDVRAYGAEHDAGHQGAAVCGGGWGEHQDAGGDFGCSDGWSCPRGVAPVGEGAVPAAG